MQSDNPDEVEIIIVLTTILSSYRSGVLSIKEALEMVREVMSIED